MLSPDVETGGRTSPALAIGVDGHGAAAPAAVMPAAPSSSSDYDGPPSYQHSAAAPPPAQPSYGGSEAEDHGPRVSTAVTSALCSPCGQLNGNVVTLYRCRGRPGLWPFVCQPGPDWPCNVCTFGLILGPTVPFLLLVAPKLHWAVVLAGVLLTGVTAALLALTAFSDPGYVPKQTPAQMEVQRQQMEEQGLSGTFTVCQFCNVIRVQHTTHCYDCNACVLELDHHCPWMSKCVAKGNLMYFYGFLWSVVVLIIFTAAAFFTWLITKATNQA